MPISTLRGSLDSTSTPEGVTNEYIEETIPVASTVLERVAATPIYKDTKHHSSVLTLDMSASVLQGIDTFVAGYGVEVTYYRKHIETSNLSGDTANLDAETIHDAYVRINGMQLRFSASIQFSHLTEENKNQVTGNVVTYPGFVPKVGDFFLYAIGNTGNIAKFDIMSVERLSIASNSCYQCAIAISEFVDSAWITAVEEHVSEVMFFDLKAFAEGRGTLLHTDEKILMLDALKLIDVLQEYYVEMFYDRLTMCSIMRPDDVYDPYITEFIRRNFEHRILGTYPTQLIGNVRDYAKSYWNFLERPHDEYRTRVYGYYEVVTKTNSPRDTTITALVNRDYVQLVDTETDTTEPYMSAGLAAGGMGADPTDFETVIQLYLNYQQFDANLLLELAGDYSDLTEDEQFYQIPVYVFLLSHMVAALRQGLARTVLTTAAEHVPTRYEFTQTTLSAGNILVTKAFMKDGEPMTILSVLDNNGVEHHFEDGEITYTEDTFHVDFTGLMERLTLTELTGTWTLVLTGA